MKLKAAAPIVAAAVIAVTGSAAAGPASASPAHAGTSAAAAKRYTCPGHTICFYRHSDFTGGPYTYPDYQYWGRWQVTPSSGSTVAQSVRNNGRHDLWMQLAGGYYLCFTPGRRGTTSSAPRWFEKRGNYTHCNEPHP